MHIFKEKEKRYELPKKEILKCYKFSNPDAKRKIAFKSNQQLIDEKNIITSILVDIKPNLTNLKTHFTKAMIKRYFRQIKSKEPAEEETLPTTLPTEIPLVKERNDSFDNEW